MPTYPRPKAKMTPVQFSMALDHHNISMRRFSDLSGPAPKTVERMLSGERDIPDWVPVLLALLDLPGAMDRALAVADHYAALYRPDPSNDSRRDDSAR